MTLQLLSTTNQVQGIWVIQYLPLSHLPEHCCLVSPCTSLHLLAHLCLGLVLHLPHLFCLTSFRVAQTSKQKSQEEEKTSVPTASQQLLHFHFPTHFLIPLPISHFSTASRVWFQAGAPPLGSPALGERRCQSMSFLL